MQSELEITALPHTEETGSEINISTAWSMLSHLGYPARYGGKAQDGSYEYVIIHPKTGDFLAKGKGLTLECSMCDAARNARIRLNGGETPCFR
jgi:hypothetical protein